MACKYCIRNNGKVQPIRKDGSMYLGLSPEHRTLHVEYTTVNKRVVSFDHHFGYCPMCGDRLGGAKQFKREFLKCKSYHTARKMAPWAVRIAEVEGGFMAFEDGADYTKWKNGVV